MRNIASVSASSAPSGAHVLGYNATTAAARRPTRGLAIARSEEPDNHDRRRSEHARPQDVREHAAKPERGRDREEDRVDRRMLRGWDLDAEDLEPRRDERLPLGEQIGARMVEVRVAAEGVVAPLGQDVRDAYGQAPDRDAPQPPGEADGALHSPRHGAA